MKTVAQTVIEADRFYTIAATPAVSFRPWRRPPRKAISVWASTSTSPSRSGPLCAWVTACTRIRNRASGKLLDLTMTGTANGTWLHLWEDVGGTSQMWTVQPTPEGTVRLRSSWAGGKCVDTVGMGAAMVPSCRSGRRPQAMTSCGLFPR